MVLVYTDSQDNRFKVEEKVVQILKSYRQVYKKDKEAGGVLLGRFIKGSEDIVVDYITEPMAGDIRGRYKFIRKDIRHQNKIDEVWQESDGTCNYLGDWHTHPEDDPVPSNVDQANWLRKLKEDKYSGRYLYFLIVGLIVVSIWRADNQTGAIEKLNYEKTYTEISED